MPELCINSIGVVLNGDFNPSIFQPAWFSSQKLLPESEAEAISDLTAIQRDIVRFRLPWLDFQVLQQQFNCGTSKESHFNALHDFVLGTFRILRHTPVRQMGINLQRHYRLENDTKWNSFGHALAPKTLWKKIMKDPGMVSLSVVDKVPHRFPSGHVASVRIQAEGSMTIKPNGIYLLVNSHFECGDPSGTTGANGAIDILEKAFSDVLSFSTEACETIINQYEQHE